MTSFLGPRRLTEEDERAWVYFQKSKYNQIGRPGKARQAGLIYVGPKKKGKDVK